MIKKITPIIRLASLQDSEVIAQTHIYSWQKIYKEFIPESILMNLSLAERTQQWHELIKQGVKVLVIEIKNKIVGFASICSFRDSDTDSLAGEISAIYLHPTYWRMGLGTELCLAAISELKHLGYNKIFLWVLQGNSQARKFYESLDFETSNSTKLEEFYPGGALLREILYKKTF